jgi:hypothetical protein
VKRFQQWKRASVAVSFAIVHIHPIVHPFLRSARARANVPHGDAAPLAPIAINPLFYSVYEGLQNKIVLRSPSVLLVIITRLVAFKAE